MDFKVVIPAAGTGSRLGEICTFLNKSLVSVANRPGISHIIEKFEPRVPIVVALGYKGSLVREFLQLAYPERVFEFFEVHPYEGPGSGLGLSLLTCRGALQCPFVFCSCDTIVEDAIPPPTENWMGYAEVSEANEYRTLGLSGDRVVSIREKKAADADHHAYIGLAGVHDYRAFWAAMTETPLAEVTAQGESCGMRRLLPQSVAARCFRWHDTGTVASLGAARAALRVPDAPNILPKPNEDIWFVGNHVIKFSSDPKFIAGRVARATSLRGYCPDIDGAGLNMYRYRRAEGEVLSRIGTRPLLAKLLERAQTFWAPRALSASESDRFHAVCLEFYQAKTLQRLEQFYRTFNWHDVAACINGVAIPSCAELLSRIDWKWLSQGKPGNFHGDFHFENILYHSETDRFTFLDWRQDFGGLSTIGDIYYDLAKLNHGLIVCHDLISRDLFEVFESPGNIRFEVTRKQSLVECEEVFRQFLLTHGYDERKVRILTALIYLNIAALHHHPYSLLLYYLGRWLLAQQVAADLFRT